MSEDKSAIDKIDEMYSDVNNIKKQLNMIESMLKIILQKLNKKTEQEKVQQPLQVMVSPGQVNISHEQKASGVSKKQSSVTFGKNKVYSYIYDQQGNPFYNAVIRIYNSNSELVKNITSDKAGYWEVRLPNGKYGVELIRDGKAINKVITVQDQDVEVK